MNTTLKSIIIIAFSLLFAQSYASANTYYVAQSSAGSGDGSSFSNRMSVSRHNSRSFSGNDIIYLCDTITSTVTPPSSGTSGHYITYRGDYAGHAGVLNHSFAESSRGLNVNGKNYLIIDGLEVTGQTLSGIWIYNGSTHVAITNCEIHHIYGSGEDADSTGINLSGSASYITIGGSSGNGNNIHHIGKGTGSGDIQMQENVTNVIISYNTIWSDGTDYGIDGIVNTGCDYLLIEYNTIYGHQEAQGSNQGEDGIDMKECHDIIIRYNEVYGNRQNGINTQHGSYHLYIYGNRSHDNSRSGIMMYQFADSATMHDNFAYSNILYNNIHRGITVQSSGGSIQNINIFNNTIAENGLGSTSDWTGALVTNGSTHNIKNNIFYKNRPTQSNYMQARYSGATVKLDYNRYYWPSKTSTVYYDGTDMTPSTLQRLYSQDTHSSEGNPGLTNIANNDYTIIPGAAVIDAGIVMGNGGVIATVTIQGVGYPVYWDTALDPATNWSTVPPAVVTSRRGMDGWDIGAYAYTGDNSNIDVSPPEGLRIIK